MNLDRNILFPKASNLLRISNLKANKCIICSNDNKSRVNSIESSTSFNVNINKSNFIFIEAVQSPAIAVLTTITVV